jgi:hypothetical protein
MSCETISTAPASQTRAIQTRAIKEVDYAVLRAASRATIRSIVREQRISGLDHSLRASLSRAGFVWGEEGFRADHFA